MTEPETYRNPDLEVVAGNKSVWTHADNRRRGWHGLHRIARYTLGLRAARVVRLEKRMELRLAELDAVRHFTSLPWFSAMVVVQEGRVLYERYAPDFGPDRPHSIQSISKTTLHFIIGQLVDAGVLSLSQRVGHYLPEVGTGYRDATLQQVLNMDVVNEYTEDFTDPSATYYQHEEAMGWRLPRDPAHEQTQRAFVARIRSDDIENRTGLVQYKDANTDVLGWIAERASGRPLRAFLADLVDAAGLEGAFHVTTDRDGVPALDGGVCLTARDLARYMMLFVRRGRGISGERVAGPDFMARTLAAGVPMSVPFDWIRYSNHTMVAGPYIGHGGWGGQYAIANLDTGRVAVFFSVIENEHATNRDYLGPVVKMLEAVTAS